MKKFISPILIGICAGFALGYFFPKQTIHPVRLIYLNHQGKLLLTVIQPPGATIFMPRCDSVSYMTNDSSRIEIYMKQEAEEAQIKEIKELINKL